LHIKVKTCHLSSLTQEDTVTAEEERRNQRLTWLTFANLQLRRDLFTSVLIRTTCGVRFECVDMDPVLDVGDLESEKADSVLDAVHSASNEANSASHEADSVHNDHNDGEPLPSLCRAQEEGLVVHQILLAYRKEESEYCNSCSPTEKKRPNIEETWTCGYILFASPAKF
jgi:hypothetical protein